MNVYGYGYVNDSFCSNSVLQLQVSIPCLMAQWSLNLQLRHHTLYTGLVPTYYVFRLFSISSTGIDYDNYDSPSSFFTRNIFKQENYILLHVCTQYMYLVSFIFVNFGFL